MRRYATLAIPIAFLAAAAVLRAVATYAPAALRADFAQPIVVVTAWKGFGGLYLGTLTLAVAIGAVAHRIALRSARQFSLRELVASSALALLAAWCIPVILSSDVYAYAAYGELARLGLDPYAHVHLDPRNGLFAAAIWQWGNPPPVCVYGPLFVEIARVVVAVGAPFGIVAQLDALRAIASLAFIACIPLAYAIRRGEPVERLTGAATIGLNPVAIWCAAEGHNDALAIAIALAGFLIFRRQAALGALLMACAALVKPPAAAVLTAIAATHGRARTVAAVTLAVVAAFLLRLFAGIAGHLAPSGRYDPQVSLGAVVRPFALLISHDERIAAFVSIAATVTVGALLATRGIARLRSGHADGWLWCAVAIWAIVPNPYPWYGLWLLAVAALVPPVPVGRVAVLLSLSSWLRYVPDAIGTPGPILTVALGVAASLPFCILIPRRDSAIMSRSA